MKFSNEMVVLHTCIMGGILCSETVSYMKCYT